MQKDSFRVRAADLLDIPADIKGGLLHIEITGKREVFIENHKGILELSENEVTLNAGKETVRVLGQKLRVLAMNNNEIRLSGIIESVGFVREGSSCCQL
ncbi:MAG: sporulation protein [Oscillospiraceae bacterium]|nr:sporulation protein [Oscillospiraceae bacterium]